MELTQTLEIDGYLVKILFYSYPNGDYFHHWEVYNDNQLVEGSNEIGDGGYESEDDCVKWALTFIRNYRHDHGFSS